jgi:hypothetical protein
VGSGEYRDEAVVEDMRDRPKGEVIEGFYHLSMQLLIQLVKERGVDGNEQVLAAARRTLKDLREKTPGNY